MANDACEYQLFIDGTATGSNCVTISGHWSSTCAVDTAQVKVILTPDLSLTGTAKANKPNKTKATLTSDPSYTETVNANNPNNTWSCYFTDVEAGTYQANASLLVNGQLEASYGPDYVTVNDG